MSYRQGEITRAVTFFDLKEFPAIYERVASIINSRSRRDVAAALKMTYTGVSNLLLSAKGKTLEKGPKNLPYKQLVNWALDQGVSVDWLLTGKGDPELTSQRKENSTAPTAIRQATISMPSWNSNPLNPSEKELLEKALGILRSEGLEGEPDAALARTIDALYPPVRKTLGRPAVLGEEKRPVRKGQGGARK